MNKKGLGDTSELSTISVYPSTLITLECPKCQNRGDIKLKNPPKKGFTITCKKCNEKISVKLNIRSFYRKDIFIPVKYTLKSKKREGVIVDISMGGVSIDLKLPKFLKPFEKHGSIIEMVFTLPPKEEALSVFGEIVRIAGQDDGKYSLGVKFVNLQEYAKKEIGYFLM